MPTLRGVRQLQIRRQVPVRPRRERTARFGETPQVQDGTLPHLPHGRLLSVRPQVPLHPQRWRGTQEPPAQETAPDLTVSLHAAPLAASAAASQSRDEAAGLQQDLRSSDPSVRSHPLGRAARISRAASHPSRSSPLYITFSQVSRFFLPRFSLFSPRQILLY